jgi:hypothetical protein
LVARNDFSLQWHRETQKLELKRFSLEIQR